MVYVTGGRIMDSRIRSPWRLGIIAELFWGIINFVVLFFQTLVKPNSSSKGSSYSSDYRVSGTRPGPGGGGGGGGGGRGGPHRRMGGFRGGPGGAGPPPMSGGG